jgi:pentatricopeptide repeat protein
MYRSAFLAARLVSVYARFGLVIHARKVFDEIPFEGLSNMLLWNSILRASVSNGYYEEGLKLYDKMRKLGVWADGFTLPLVIKACAVMGGLNLCKNVHSHVLQMGFQNHLHVVNELVGMYGKLGRMEDARRLFDRMAVRSYISWNTMVSGYAFNYDCDGAFEMFRKMELEGLEPNPVTWTSLLSSHARCGQNEETVELFGVMRMRGIGATAEVLAVVLSVCADMVAVGRGKVIHGYVIKGGFENYLFVKNALIYMYGKCGDVKYAQNLFLEMETKNLVSWNALITSHAESGLCDEAFAIFSQLETSDDCPMIRPNVISWSAVIDGFASKGQGEESLKLFRQMQLAKVMATCVTISSVLSICAELAALNLGREIHGHVVRALMDSNILVGNGLINMYTKCGSFEEAHLVFEKIDGRDLISWNSMISGYGLHGLGEKALKTFDQMIKCGFKPDNVTFVAVLSACSHAGLVSEGRRLFNEMTLEFRVEPQMEHYACMVDLLGRAGLLQEASDIVKNMPMEPNDCVLGALLNSCRMYKNTDVAEETASHIFNKSSETTGNYMLLSNIYAASGRWEDSARTRISAKTKGLKKIPGQSWIEVKKNVYVFSAGNTLQPGLGEVYGILEELALQMESECRTVHNSIFGQSVDEEEMCT